MIASRMLSGFCLLIIVYYVGADLFLIDRHVLDIANWQAIGLSMGSIVLGWLAFGLVGLAVVAALVLALREWAAVLQAEAQALKGRTVHLKDKAYLRWTDSADTMVVTFGEVAEGARTGPIKRQYWTRRGQQWQIFFEGVIG